MHKQSLSTGICSNYAVKFAVKFKRLVRLDCLNGNAFRYLPFGANSAVDKIAQGVFSRQGFEFGYNYGSSLSFFSINLFTEF